MHNDTERKKESERQIKQSYANGEVYRDVKCKIKIKKKKMIKKKIKRLLKYKRKGCIGRAVHTRG